MEFVTIHDLSTHFDIPARVIRYRFHQLRQAGRLIDGQDYRRDDFVDEQHFEWKINPVSFARETGMRPGGATRSHKASSGGLGLRSTAFSGRAKMRPGSTLDHIGWPTPASSGAGFLLTEG